MHSLKLMLQILGALMPIVLFASPAYSQVACDLQPAFMHPIKAKPKDPIQVRKTSDGRALVFVSGLHTNTDGTVRSYKIGDFWGADKALNNLCNAMTDKCDGPDGKPLSKMQLQERRELTQAAEKAGWPVNQVKATKISSSIIALDPQGKPCTNADGFLVSATSLTNKAITDQCDIARYVDALKVSAIVLPGDPVDPKDSKKRVPSGFTSMNARRGDLVAVWRHGQSNVQFAVVGDHGPAKALGEASIALNGRLLGKTNEPENYQEIRGRSPFRGRGWDVDRAVTVVFANSGNAAEPFMTQDRIDVAAKPLFEAFGGLDRLKACVQ